MPLQVQIQRFDEHARATRAGACALKFLFSKNSNGPLYVLIFSCENWHAGSFYSTIMNKCKKIEISVLKTPFFGPQKVRFWFLKKKKTKKYFLRVFALIHLKKQ